jgi:hypothetical protein
MTDKIICAACRCGDVVVCGVHHYDKIMRDVMYSLNFPFSGQNVDQGFVNQRGEFLDRHQALLVATIAGQLIRKTQPADRLFSEDLW